MTDTTPTYVRKLVVQVDETRREMGRDVNPPTRRALAMAVIANPCAGRYEENLDALIAIGEELGALLGQKCVQALGITPAQAQSYGKAAIVGEGTGEGAGDGAETGGRMDRRLRASSMTASA